MQLRCLAIGVALGVCVPFLLSADTEPEKKAFPEFKDVQFAVAEHLRQNKSYRPGEILTAGDVAQVFTKIEKLGWKVDDQKGILQLFLPDGDDMVKRLRTPKGRPFMDRVGHLPLGYDRLDRLRKMPHGQHRIRELVEGPDGDTLIEYMTTTRGGKNMGKQLTNATNGENFNKPTGKLYTEKAFLDRLQMSYDAHVARGTAASKPSP